MAIRRGRRTTVGQRGFTLIEVMVVLVILGMIAAAIAVNVIAYKKEADLRVARMDMKTISDAIEVYRLKHSRLPDTLEALVQERALKKPPVDPWHGRYLLEQAENADGYRITSYGADGAPGGEGANADLHSDDPDSQ